jgi:hypothetical protein
MNETRKLNFLRTVPLEVIAYQCTILVSKQQIWYTQTAAVWGQLQSENWFLHEKRVLGAMSLRFGDRFLIS